MFRNHLILTASVLGIASIANADVLHVPSQYGSIQSAINVSSDGDEIVVAAGTYTGNLDTMGKAITLRSADGPYDTILQAPSSGGSVISIKSGEGNDTVVRGFTVTGGTGTNFLGQIRGGGLYCVQTSPTIERCIFAENHVSGSGGGAYIFSASAKLNNCAFRNNSAGFGDGGGGLALTGGTATIMSCVFENNESGFFGGGVNNLTSFSKLVNCTFTGNYAPMGGAIRNSASSPQIINCTIFDNTAGYGAGIRSTSGGSPVVRNTIIWGNTNEEGGVSLLDIGTTSEVTYSNIAGGFAGAGNIDADPMFQTGPDSPYRIDPNSPCVDAGDTSAVPAGVDEDVDGNPRIAGAAVDMGAHEPQAVEEEEEEEEEEETNPCAMDLDGSGGMDFGDLLSVLVQWGPCSGCAADFNGDNVVDLNDVVTILSNWGPCP